MPTGTQEKSKSNGEIASKFTEHVYISLVEAIPFWDTPWAFLLRPHQAKTQTDLILHLKIYFGNIFLVTWYKPKTFDLTVNWGWVAAVPLRSAEDQSCTDMSGILLASCMAGTTMLLLSWRKYGTRQGVKITSVVPSPALRGLVQRICGNI